ncbi:MAG: porin [Desulfobacteraceae bacterium]|nr:MAG: porin [Desulfobacteraceae bacterium]
MKKVLIGFIIAAVMMAANSAQAVTVFKKGGFTYKIGGDWQIQLRQDPGFDQDMDVEYDDLEIKNSVSYKINDNLTAFGKLDFGFKNAADKPDSDADPHLEEAVLGFKIQDVKVFFGKTDSAGDEFGVAATYETIVADDCFDEFGEVSGDDLIGMSGKFGGMFEVYATYEIEAESEKSDGNGSFFDIFVAASFEGFTLGGAYQVVDPQGDGDDEITTYGIQASYDAGFAEFGVDYSTTEYEDNDYEPSIWNVAVSIPVKPVTIALGYVNLDNDDMKEDVAGWYLNATYKFPTAKNVSIFAEISDSDYERADGEETDMGYMVGMRIKF